MGIPILKKTVLLGFSIIILMSLQMAFPIGHATSTSITYSSNATLSGDVSCTDLTINPGVTLTTNGFNINCSGVFNNQGTIITGNSPLQDFPNSYGGSGGGGQSNLCNAGTGAGYSTRAPGGQGNSVDHVPTQGGNTPSSPTLSASLIQTWVQTGITGFLAGAGGETVCSNINGGAGAYGLYVTANQIIAGTIDANGHMGTGTCSGRGLSGSGGGGALLFSYGSGGYTSGSYNLNGGNGVPSCDGLSVSGAGGSGQVLTFSTGGSPSPAAGQTWTNVAPTNPPSARGEASLVYDVADGYSLLFGGASNAGVLGDTWKFSGGTWTNLSPANSPPGRVGGAMVYDTADGYVLLFGGLTTGGALADTWKFVNGQWTQLNPSVSPPARDFASIAYDVADGYVVLFAGAPGTSFGFLSDTWQYKAGVWTQLSPTQTPSSRAAQGMEYDQADHYVVMFGGSSDFRSSGAGLGDTWKFSSGSWSQLSPATSPDHRYTFGMAYDSALSATIVFGGWVPGGACGNTVGDTWQFLGGSWTQLSPSQSPSSRQIPQMDYDAATQSILLFGGQENIGAGPSSGCGTPNLLSDTWEFGGSAAPSPTSTSVSCTPALVQAGTATTAGSASKCVAQVTGGSSPVGVITFTSSSSTGAFSPSSQCKLVAGGCSTSYSDSVPGNPTIVATYGGDSSNAQSSGNIALTVAPLAIGIRNVISMSQSTVSFNGLQPCLPFADLFTSCFSIQQNFFVNVPGQSQPTYWVQNLVMVGTNVIGTFASSQYQVFPGSQNGLLACPDKVGPACHFTISQFAQIQSSQAFTITSTISGTDLKLDSSFQLTNGQTQDTTFDYQLPATGAYIIQATSPFGNFYLPQLDIAGEVSAAGGLVAYQAGFQNPTQGNVQSFVEVVAGQWSSAVEQTLLLCGSPCDSAHSGTQTAETSLNLGWTPNGSNSAAFAYTPGINTQGVSFSITTTTTTTNCTPSSIGILSTSSCTATVVGAPGPVTGYGVTWLQTGGSGSVNIFSPGTCTLSSQGTCSITVSGGSVGNIILQAAYGGNPNDGSAGTTSFTVNLSAPNLVFAAHSPINIVITDPKGFQSGFKADGTSVNQIPGAVLVGPTTEPETVTIPSPLVGPYQIAIFGKVDANPAGSPFTIIAQTVDISGLPISNSIYSGSAVPGFVQTILASLSSDGQTVLGPRMSVSDFFTDGNGNTLSADNLGNLQSSVILSNGKVRSTNPGQVAGWVNITNTGPSPLQSLILNETLPLDWTINPGWLPAKGALSVLFEFSNGTLVDITGSTTITVTTGNPETIYLSISNIAASAAGQTLGPGESILLSAKLSYGLIGTNQTFNSYPRNYIGVTSAFAWMLPSFSGGQISSSGSSFFKAYAKVLGDVDGDGVVNLQDASMMAYAFGSRPGDARWNPALDVFGQGVIDLQDVSYVYYYYGNHA